MNYVLILIVQSVWFSLPMYISNMMPVLVKKLPFLDIPIDLGKTWKGKPIFGSHKTYRGFVFGILSSIIVVFLQKELFLYGGDMWKSISIFNYQEVSFVVLGFLFGFGALLGDAVESFFKRRVGIPPGKSWFFFDQVDYVIGSLLCVSTLFVPSVAHIIMILALGLGGSFLSSYIGYHAGLKESEV